MNPSSEDENFWVWAESPTHAEITDYCGKWMLFIPTEQIDETWEQIRAATEAGSLGVEAKATTARPNSLAIREKDRLICVYTRDCRDLRDVCRVLMSLRHMGFSGRLNYKEDSATLAGIYGKGASLYTSATGDTIKRLRSIVEPGEEPGEVSE